MLGKAVKNIFLAGPVQIIHDIGHIVDAAYLDICAGNNAGEFLAHLGLDNLDRRGGNALDFRDTLHHLNLLMFFQLC